MRIIAGEFGGRRLSAPKGTSTRPTTERVRESLMSALASERGGFDGAVALDAFAGSGALGLEVISRGGAFAVLCDCDAGAVRVMEGNVRSLGLGRERVCVKRTDVMKHGAPRARVPYDLVLLDPPYATDVSSVFGLLARLDQTGGLSADVIVSYEHDAADNVAVDACLEAGAFRLASRRSYGDTVIDIMEREEEQQK